MILGEVNLKGKIIKLGIDALLLFCHLLCYYPSRVKESKKALNLVTSGEENNLSRWEEV